MAFHVDAVGDLGQVVDPVASHAVVGLDDRRAPRGQLDLGVRGAVAQPDRVEELHHQLLRLAQQRLRVTARLGVAGLDEARVGVDLVGRRDEDVPPVEAQRLDAELGAVQVLLHQEPVEIPGQVLRVELLAQGVEALHDRRHVRLVAHREDADAAGLVDRLHHHRQPIGLDERPQVLLGPAHLGGDRADAQRVETPAHARLVQQQLHRLQRIPAESELVVDLRRGQKSEFPQRYDPLEREALMQRPHHRQNALRIGVVDEQRLVDIRPVGPVVLVRILDVHHAQPEFMSFPGKLGLSPDHGDCRPPVGRALFCGRRSGGLGVR